MKLGTLFSDGAVLQREQSVAVWGETLPRVLVQAEIAGKTAYARSSGSGEFLLQLPPLEAGGPFELTVSSPDRPEESVTIGDVMIGDVWLCSGQSNMQYCLGSNWAAEPPFEGTVPVSRRQEKEYVDTVCPAPDIRFITVPREIEGCREKYFEGAWCPMTRESAPEASAIGAWFAAEIRKNQGIPVGLICCSWGGSNVESWISPEALRSDPETRGDLEAWEEMRREEETWTVEPKSPLEREKEELSRIAKPDRGNTGFPQGWASPELDDSSWSDMEIPGSWIEQEIAGDGAVWVRMRVNLPETAAGKELQLKLGGVDKHDITYFNGVEVGRTGKELEIDFWNQPRCYRIPGDLVKAGENTIAIRAFSFAFDGGFTLTDRRYALTGPGLDIPLAGIWKARAEYDLGLVAVTLPRPPAWGIHQHNTPGILFDGMIRPLLPYALRGVLWYQGENNAKSVETARAYIRRMETLIRDWRLRFDLPELPFIQVQLAEYRTPKVYSRLSAWAELRNSQGAVCRSLPNVFLATALGTGEENDIHPQNKKEVGLRMAAAALHHVYHDESVLPSGPVFVKAVPEGGKLRLLFKYADGMELKDVPEKGFYLAGADGKFFPAETAEICGDTILLASGQVKAPLSVRYAWSDHPCSILWNRKYPAASFRSEDERAAE